MKTSHVFDGISAIDFTQMTEFESECVLAFRNHPDTAKWMYSNDISWRNHLNFIASLVKNPHSHYWLFKKDEVLLGVGSLTRLNLLHKHAYLGIYKNPILKGVGSEILQTLEKIAFRYFCLHSLHLEVMQTNKKAIGFYKKQGYCFEGKLIEFIYQNSSYQDALIYGKRNFYV